MLLVGCVFIGSYHTSLAETVNLLRSPEATSATTSDQNAKNYQENQTDNRILTELQQLPAPASNNNLLASANSLSTENNLVQNNMAAPGDIIPAPREGEPLSNNVPIVNDPIPLPGQRLWNLQDADIRAVISEVSRETGKNFIVDPRVQGKVSIISSTPIDKEGVYQLFLLAIQVLGFDAVESGNTVKIVPTLESKSGNIPIMTKNLGPEASETIVARVIPIKFVSAEQLVPVLRPLLPQWGEINAYRPANALVIVARAGTVAHLYDIIQQIDTRSSNGTTVITLRNAFAEEMVQTLKALQNNSGGAMSELNPGLAADNQSNSIIITGNGATRLRMKVLIAQLDSRSQMGGMQGTTQIIPLKYLRAKDLVPILAGIAKSQFGGEVGIVIGSSTSQTPLHFGNGEPASQNVDASVNPNPMPVPSAGAPTLTLGPTSSVTQTEAGSNKPRLEIIAEPNTNSIILNAPAGLMHTLKEVIMHLDVRPAQVAIQALVVEIDEDHISQLGIEWGSIGNSLNLLGLANGFTQGIGVITQNGIKAFQARIIALASDNRANILSTPSVVVLNNQQASIAVGTQLSAKESEYPNNGNGTTTASPFTTFSRLNVALHLYVTPQINHDNSIQLIIDHGNDTLQNPGDPTENPIVNTSSIKTSVLIDSGNILVLGGLIQNKLQDKISKVPILGDAPFVGPLFRAHSRTRNKNKLMVFIRPIILRDPLMGTQLTKQQYVNMRREELEWLQKQPYHPHNSQMVLPHWQQPPALPKPFH